MPRRHLLLACLLLCLAPLRAAPQNAPAGLFVEKPYIQLGDSPTLQARESLKVMWQTADEDARWAVETREAAANGAGANGGAWRACAPPEARRVAVEAIAPHRVWSATLEGLTPGAEVDYRLLKDGAPVFQARARARKSAAQSQRFVVFGDCAENTPGQRAVAYQTYKLKPDFVFIPGDIVYTHGAVREYRAEYFPIYNADTASAQTGAPLLRSTLFLSALGNHDVEGANLGAWPDGLAYFYYWAQPLNGPLGALNAPGTPAMSGPDPARRAFLAAANPAYPRMASYSFDYGNAHWTVLDSNPYADWSKPPLRTWLEADLAAAKNATWRFVTFHHPGFSGEGRVPDLARMEAVAKVFEQGKVDVVFNGHVHTYLCSRPMRLAGGQWQLDTQYDGKMRTKPKGVIYVVTGAGGAHLHQLGMREMLIWQMLTRKFVPGIHSLTVADITGRRMVVRQIAADGRELDRYILTK